MRSWIQWLYTDDRRTLEMPPVYLHSRVLRNLTTWDRNRRQANWDDHGEVYAAAQEGPDLYCNLKIPSGLFVLSLYNVNYNGGEDSADRYRDYVASIRPHKAGTSLRNIKDFEGDGDLVRTRFVNFRGGVWKRFLVQGPVVLNVRIGRNNSSNTILSSVMLDMVAEEPEPYFPALVATTTQADASRPKDPTNNVARLARIRTGAPSVWASASPAIYALMLRQYSVSVFDSAQKRDFRDRATCHYELCDFSAWENGQVRQGLTPARKIEKGLRWDGVSGANSGGERRKFSTDPVVPIAGNSP
jgi:hypothetical protein